VSIFSLVLYFSQSLSLTKTSVDVTVIVEVVVKPGFGWVSSSFTVPLNLMEFSGAYLLFIVDLIFLVPS